MKKIITLIVSVTLISLLSATNCVFASDLSYDDALDLTLEEIDKVTSGATLVANCNIAIWERTVPSQRVIDNISEFLRYGNTKAGNPLPSPENMKMYIEIFGSSKEALENAKTYYEFYYEIPTFRSIVDMIDRFEQSFPDHPDVSKALQVYFLKVSEFLLSAIDPSTGYTYYLEKLTTLHSEMLQLRKNVELAK